MIGRRLLKGVVKMPEAAINQAAAEKFFSATCLDGAE
jgi:hypothetical protein